MKCMQSRKQYTVKEIMRLSNGMADPYDPGMVRKAGRGVRIEIPDITVS